MTVVFTVVRLPTEVVVDPRVRVLLPSVAVLLARPELGMVVAAVTLPVFALPYR